MAQVIGLVTPRLASPEMTLISFEVAQLALKCLEPVIAKLMRRREAEVRQALLVALHVVPPRE